MRRLLGQIRRKLKACIGQCRDRLPRPLFPYEDNALRWDGSSIVLRGFRGDHVTRQLRQGTFYESELLAHLLARYGTGGLYVDVGAFIGNHTLFFAKVCKADLVVAFEPCRESFRLLSHNVLTNSATNVLAHNLALGEAETIGYVHVTDPCNLGANRICLGPSQGELPIPIRTADGCVSATPKLIKIDTEGSALRVLRGCASLISAHHPVIVVETFPEPLEPVQAFLQEWRYSLRATFNCTPTHIFE
jgi:FkbM family methyltransferase